MSPSGSPTAGSMKWTKTNRFCGSLANCGWKANESSPASPWTVTRLEISRNGPGSSVPPCAMRIRPGRSAMKSRASPGGACKSIGLERPAELPKTSCNCALKGGKSTLFSPHAAGRNSPRTTGSECHILMRKLLLITQHLQMRHHAPPERGKRVASLENRDDLSPGIFVGDFLDALRDPGVVGLGKAQAGHVVLDVGIEPCRDEGHLRLELVERRHPDSLHRRAQSLAVRACGQRHVGHVRRGIVGAAVGIERMLEYARHHDALVVAEDVLGAVAMVHVEVDDRHALDAVMLERVLGPDSDVVEEAKPHRAGARRVMTRRAHRAKGAVGAPADHEVRGEHRGPRRAKRRIPGMRAHRGIGIEVHDSALRRGLADRFDVFEWMHPGELAHLGRWRIVALEQSRQTRGDEVV